MGGAENDGRSELLHYGPLTSSKNPHFQNEEKCTTFLVKMKFYLHENEKSFRYQRLST